MQIDTQSITDAARAALLAQKIDGSRRLTGTQFKAAYAHAVSSLGLTAGANVEGLAPALRHELNALIQSRNAVVLAGMAAGIAGKTRIVLTADGSSARVSVPYSRAGTDAETITAAKAVLAKTLATDASEGARAQHAARLRHATATLCRLDADYALEDAKLRILAAQAYAAKLEQAKVDRANAAAAAAAGKPVTDAQVARAAAAAAAADAKAQAKVDANKRKRDIRAAKRHANVPSR